MNKQANVAANTLKQLIVRISPVSGVPVLFDALSKENGQLKCVVNGEDKIVGLDFYSASIPMEDDAARQVVQAYAERVNAPVESFVVRHRLPKAHIAEPAPRKARKLNDANLVLAADNTKSVKKGEQESNQDYRSKSELEAAVQQMHDAATKKPVSEPVQQASAENPEGATVKPQERQRRKYERTAKSVRTKRSAAALKRYHEELQTATKDSQDMLQPVEASPDVPQATVDEAKLTAAIKLAKIILEAGIL